MRWDEYMLILVTNPVDVITHLVQEWCKGILPRNRILGSGTYLDTQRLRVGLAKHLNIATKNIHAYVIGEHGDSQIHARSSSHIGGVPLDSFQTINDDFLTEIETQTKRKAYEIIKSKGSTSHGIGECVASICENILLDKKEVMTVSSFHPKHETCFGWPTILGVNGVEQLLPIKLTENENDKLNKTVHIMKEIVNRNVSE